ncbi:MAG TPA: hypothetical protein DD979_09795 [Gammaproteobacteria bacterium]|nr:hypothetical protein [Gammaproteobacteria bacterium]
MHYVFLAGIGNSGEGHWQRLWYEQRSESASWVEHADWDNPVMETWLANLEATVAQVEEDIVVVAHSLGCVLLTEWLKRHHHPSLAAALLVAIPDTQGSEFPPQAKHFSNLDHPIKKPCPMVVVASDDDPYGSVEHAKEQASALNAEFRLIGKVGHINASSGLGDWPEGKQVLKNLLEKCV